jgi:hypothetical protein
MTLMKRELISALALAVCVAGCGRSNEEVAQERAAQAAAQAGQAAQEAGEAAQRAGYAAQDAGRAAQQAGRTTEQAAGDAARGFEDMAKALGALAGTGSDGKAVDPVSFRDLIALMPDVGGWEKGTPTGERMTAPFPFSTATTRYTRGNARIEVKMTDSGFNQLLLAPYAMFLSAGYERETTEGYEKSTQVNGHPGWEKWDSTRRSGELNALVGKRYLLQIEGRNIDDPRALHEVANRLDLARLAALQ